MTTRIVLAYSGGVRASAAIGWLRERYQADVITLTVDVGQERDLEEIRARALALGAVRAHVLDRRDAFAAAAIAALRGAAALRLEPAVIGGLAPPVIAAALAEVAAIEHAVMVAHAAVTGPLGDAVAADCPVPVVNVAGEWSDAADHAQGDPVEQARARGVSLPSPTARWSSSRHLLCRPVAALPAMSEAAVDLTFADAVPVAVTGVTFPPAELLESLSLLGGRHGIGRLTGPLTGPSNRVDAPAAVLLHAAYRALFAANLSQANAVVRCTLHQGSCLAAPLDRAVVTG